MHDFFGDLMSYHGQNMKNVTSLDHDFLLKMDELVSASFAHPIYHSNHSSYYKSTQNLNCLNDYSVVVVDDNGTPVVGIIAASFKDPASNKLFLSYLGNPAALLISISQSTDLINKALISLYGHFVSNGFAKILVISQFSLRIYGSQSNPFNSEVLELILKSARTIEVEFERIIDLELPKEKIHKDFSKSVLAAEKRYDKAKMETRIACWLNDKALISESITNLQSLHSFSAGRITRSSESWSIQERQIVDGSMVILNGFNEGKNVHGSLFLLSDKTAYYGVSANLLQPGQSLSHVFLVEAIFFLKDIGIKRLFFGKQYENLSGVSDAKLLNISKFKSFFGGFVTPNLLIKNEA